jgi:hypothetical protein
MGGGRPPAPTISYIPAPPPPQTQQVQSQSLESQIKLSEVAGAQQRLNLQEGAKLDRTNEEFFAGQDIRRLGAQGAEQRLGIKETGAQNRLTTQAEGTERRLTVGAMGEQERKTVGTKAGEERKTIGTRAAEERTTLGTRGTEERKGIAARGEETRATAKQEELFRRYKENRDYDQSRSAYRS